MPDTQVPTSDDIKLDDLTTVLAICRELTPAGRRRLIDTITTFFSVPEKPGTFNLAFAGGSYTTPPSQAHVHQESINATRPELSAKEFVLQKQPHTGVERVACLAYYLTHYRDTPHFKTLDISKLNTEAAQPKFANAALTVNDATKSGYLISTTKGNKQLSAAGELFVQALPNREEARSAMASARPRKRAKRSGQLKPEREVNVAPEE